MLQGFCDPDKEIGCPQYQEFDFNNICKNQSSSSGVQIVLFVGKNDMVLNEISPLLGYMNLGGRGHNVMVEHIRIYANEHEQKLI